MIYKCPSCGNIGALLPAPKVNPKCPRCGTKTKKEMKR